MLNKIIRFSLNNRLVVLVAALLLMIAGVERAKKMEVDVFPDLNAPTVVVMTEAGGMAPEEVEQLITFPIETAMNGATDVRNVRSSSTTGFSIVWIQFNWGTDIYRARQIISEKLAVVKDALPPTAGNPTLGPQSSILGELMFVELTSDSTSMRDLRTIADWQVRPALLAQGGVAQVSVLGGEVKEYQILLRPEWMAHYGVSLSEVLAAVKDMNRNVAGGMLYEYGNEYIIRGVLASHDVEALGKAVVKTENGAALTLHDVAEVRVGNKSPKMGTASYNGRSAVVMTVTKQPQTNTLELTQEIDETLQALQKSLPPDVKISTDVYRQSRFIERAVNNVTDALLEGALFVVIVLFLFLMNVRTTVISLVTIPLALVTSILALHMMGLTINTMSLGGMCIAIGSLVDDAIVDVENVYKRLRENRGRPKMEQRPVLEVIFNASREVRMPILNSTLIIVASFAPLFFLSGMEGLMLAPLGIAFIVALSSSTLVALTVTPVLCSFLLGGNKKKKRQDRELAFTVRLKNIYGNALGKALRHSRLILVATGVGFVGAVIWFMSFGHSFLPPFNEGSFTINLSSVPGISLEESNRLGQLAEKTLFAIPEIKSVGRKTGRAELDEHALGVNVSEIEAPYELHERPREEVMEEVRKRLKEIPGVNVEVGAPISHRIDAMLSGTRANIAIKLFGNDLNRLFALGNKVKAAIEKIDGVEDLNVEQQVERPQLKIEPKREMLRKYGMSLNEFGEMVRCLLGGEEVSQVYEGNRSFALVLKVADETRATAKSIGDMLVDVKGRKVPLTNVARIRSTMGPNTISREGVGRKVVVGANVAGRDLLSVVNEIQNTIEEKIDFPEGYRVEYGGQFESEAAASRTLLLTSILSILVIFLLLYGQFGSIVEAGVVLLNLPLALIGGVVAIGLSNGVVSIPSIIGFISLFGIATRNGMLLISRYNDLAAEGMSTKDCVIEGSLDRLNPILMTALTSALALIPLVVSGDLAGNEIQSPMATVILGGLFTSTLLNGFIIPIMYMKTKKTMVI